jgi:hypothetical protein
VPEYGGLSALSMELLFILWKWGEKGGGCRYALAEDTTMLLRRIPLCS